MRPMLPDAEIDRLTNAVDEAIGLAALGQVGEGYRLLSKGFMRAEGLRREGKDWGHELMLRWGQACDNYAASYGVPLEDAP
jgi:hypothetical protein